MKTELEIAKAHDILDALIHGDIPFRTVSEDKDKETLKGMMVARYVLCWILEHNRGKWFEERIIEIEAELFAKGYEFKTNDEL